MTFIVKIIASFEAQMGNSRKKLVVFSGAGMSAESGIKTFRDSGGLWEDYNIMDVATPEAWSRQPNVVLDFYNARRRQVLSAQPNKGHELIYDLENYFDVNVITQNIDDLHERAGSTRVLHLHGEIVKARSSIDPDLLYHIGEDGIRLGQKCSLGSQLRPHVVWFGEEVPAMMKAERIVRSADILLVIGTSLNVYPAAGIIHMTKAGTPIYLIDPGDPLIPEHLQITWIREKGSSGMEVFMNTISTSF